MRSRCVRMRRTFWAMAYVSFVIRSLRVGTVLTQSSFRFQYSRGVVGCGTEFWVSW